MEGKKFVLEFCIIPVLTVSPCVTMPHCVGGIFIGNYFEVNHLHLQRNVLIQSSLAYNPFPWQLSRGSKNPCVHHSYRNCFSKAQPLLCWCFPGLPAPAELHWESKGLSVTMLCTSVAPVRNTCSTGALCFQLTSVAVAKLGSWKQLYENEKTIRAGGQLYVLNF